MAPRRWKPTRRRAPPAPPRGVSVGASGLPPSWIGHADVDAASVPCVGIDANHVRAGAAKRPAHREGRRTDVDPRAVPARLVEGQPQAADRVVGATNRDPSPDVPEKLTSPFCPGTGRLTVNAEPLIVTEPVGFAGTSYRVTVMSPVLVALGSISRA